MKHITLIASLLLISFISFSRGTDSSIASIDSSAIQIDISLKAKYHAYIVSFLSDRGEVKKFNYINQFRSQIDTGYNADQVITITAPSSLVVEIYNVLGMQEERLTTTYNNEIKELLIPQIVSYPWLLRTIQSIGIQNYMATEKRVQMGVKYIMQIDKLN